MKKKHQRNKFESAFSDKPRIEITGTNHTVTTPNGRVLHGKHVSKPIADFNQEHINKRNGTGRLLYKITIQTKTSNGDRIAQRVRDTIDGRGRPKDTRASGQYNSQKEHILS